MLTIRQILPYTYPEICERVMNVQWITTHPHPNGTSESDIMAQVKDEFGVLQELYEGKVYVMNEAGKTVSHYHLGDVHSIKS